MNSISRLMMYRCKLNWMNEWSFHLHVYNAIVDKLGIKVSPWRPRTPYPIRVCTSDAIISHWTHVLPRWPPFSGHKGNQISDCSATRSVTVSPGSLVPSGHASYTYSIHRKPLSCTPIPPKIVRHSSSIVETVQSIPWWHWSAEHHVRSSRIENYFEGHYKQLQTKYKKKKNRKPNKIAVKEPANCNCTLSCLRKPQLKHGFPQGLDKLTVVQIGFKGRIIHTIGYARLHLPGK